MANFRYPHEDFSLKKIKGERWKDIPGLEGYFMVSNYARVKRLEYEIVNKKGIVHVKHKKIIKPTVLQARNKFKNDFTKALHTRIVLSGVGYHFSLTRLVYNCFVKQFDMNDKTILILCKDADNLNVIPSNLIMADLSVRARRIIELNRSESVFKTLTNDKEFAARRRERMSKRMSKQVTQFSLKGKKIKTFSSMTEAQRSTRVFASAIALAASGGCITAGGFVWQWGNEKSIDIKTIRQDRRIVHWEKYGQKVTQYDFNGNKIAEFPSLQHAELATGIKAAAIRLVINGINKSAMAYFWAKGYGKSKIDLSGYAWGRKSMAIKQSRKVKQFSLKGKFIKEYPSIKTASEAVGILVSYISLACRGLKKTGGNFVWKYA